MMTTHEIATSLHARAVGKDRWSATCPGHKDSHPSLSIAVGRNGRTLLHCHAGCETEHLLHAMGLTLRDLYATGASDWPSFISRMKPRKPIARELREALSHEAVRYRAERKIEDTLLTNELNDIRARVSRALGVNLTKLAVPVHEGSYGGRERDSLWPLALEQAWKETWIKRLSIVPLSLERHETLCLRIPRQLLIAAEIRAAILMREFGRNLLGGEVA